jgi:hypothetical protein
LSPERSNDYQRVFIFRKVKPTFGGMIEVNVNPNIDKKYVSFSRGSGYYFRKTWNTDKDLFNHIETIIKRWNPTKPITEKKESSMKLSDLKKLINETVIAEISGAEKAMQSAKIKKQIEDVQKTAAAKRQQKQDTKSEQAKLKSLHDQLKKISDIKITPAVVKEDAYEDTPEFKSKIMQVSMKQQYKSELQKKLGSGFYVEYDSGQGVLYVGPKAEDDTYVVVRLDSKTGDFNLRDFVHNKAVKLRDINAVVKYIKSIKLTESVVKESRVSDFMLWWTDEIAPSEKSKVLKQLDITNYKTFEKLSSKDKDKLIKYYIPIQKILSKYKVNETPALVHRISNKMTASKKKKTNEAADPWPYYTLKKDGYLYDEDGHRAFQWNQPKFKSVKEAEVWLEKYNERGTVTIE